jgi:hypothetical protein
MLGYVTCACADLTGGDAEACNYILLNCRTWIIERTRSSRCIVKQKGNKEGVLIKKNEKKKGKIKEKQERRFFTMPEKCGFKIEIFILYERIT